MAMLRSLDENRKHRAEPAGREQLAARGEQKKYIPTKVPKFFFFFPSPPFFQQPGVITGFVHISSLMDVGVAEVVRVDGRIYHVKSLQATM